MRTGPALVICIGALGAAFAAKPPSPLSVCELVQSGERLNGKVVSVRGVLVPAEPMARDAYFDELRGEECPPDGRTVKIEVVSPDAHFLAEPPPGYKPDPDSVRRAERIAIRAARHNNNLIATIEGVFYVVENDGQSPGRHRRYPAIIVVQAIRDVRER